MANTEQLQTSLRQHVEKLCVEIGERTTLRPQGLAEAADYIRGEFTDAGLKVSEQSYDFHGQTVVNLIAELPDAATSSAYYLVGAHYDTVPGTPGADDNASAVAVLLETARRAARNPPAAPVRFVAFTLEEPPAFNTRHQGSRVFVRRLKDTGERMLGAIVLEMVGYTAPKQGYPLFLQWAGYPKEGNFIGIVGNWRSRGFGKALEKCFRRNQRLPVESLFLPLNGWVVPDTRLSDHASFWDAGLPAVMVTDTAYFRNPNYHTSQDRIETLDFSFMAELVVSLESALESLTNAKSR